ncbi:MAG: nitroreductase family protein [Dehalococcoidales bacterium]|nr:nitroreductase family protein [Dehalococcoidales bacterium]
MDVTTAILRRRSIRRWEARPVEREKIEKVLEAGRRAPSWGNTQPWRFIVLEEKTQIETVGKASGGQPHVTTAPVLIVCCGAVNDLSRSQHRQALKELRDMGVMDWTDDFLDNVVLKSDLFAPYLLGEEMMKVRVGEQVVIAISYMTLEAVNQGLGTCWVGAINAREVQKALGLPADIFVHSLLPLGYPAEDPKPRPRRDMNRIVFWGGYRKI